MYDPRILNEEIRGNSEASNFAQPKKKKYKENVT